MLKKSAAGVAVVIPLFNHQEYVGAALDSLYAQSRPVQKIIVIDDGSTDASLERVRAARDARVEILTQTNGGAHTALNRAIQIAKDCEFIGILNSDDFYHPNRVERCLDFLETNRQSNVVCSRVELVDPAGQPLPAHDARVRWMDFVYSMEQKDPVERLGVSNFLKTSSNIFGRTGYLLEHPFKPYRYNHDYYFALVCALEHQLGVMPEVLLSYRLHNTNTIKSEGEASVAKEGLQMHLDLLRELAPHSGKSPRLRADLADYFRMLLGNHGTFRTEAFLHLLMQSLVREGGEAVGELVNGMENKCFPELVARPSRLLRDQQLTEEYLEMDRRILQSRWVALGRLFGLKFQVAEENQTPSARLAALKKRLFRSKWLRFGRLFGFGPKKLW